MDDRQLKAPCVYIMASARNGVLYAGVTSDLHGRVAVHKQDLLDGFQVVRAIRRRQWG